VVDALARVLRLTEDERRYLHLLALGAVHAPRPLGSDLPAVEIVRQLVGVSEDGPYPVYGVDLLCELIAWNRAAIGYYGDFGALPAGRRNMLRWLLEAPEARERLPDWSTDVPNVVARWRAMTALYDGGEALRERIAEFRRGTPEFPAIVLMHGFPDDLHLYDRLIPHLYGRRRIVLFDFLGWGESDKPREWHYTSHSQTRDLDQVIEQLGLESVVLVAHDASGPPAIDCALEHPDRVAGLILLNTYYAYTLRIRRPPAIALYSTPGVRLVARAVARRSARFNPWLYRWQVGRFITDDADRRELLPQFAGRFEQAREAFWALNNDLLRTVISRRRRLGRARVFPRPVRIVFGANDPHLNTSVARWFAALFPHTELHLLSAARHYVQIDRPEEVARLLLTRWGTGLMTCSPPYEPARTVGCH
jgi:haloalkane dehalogenase